MKSLKSCLIGVLFILSQITQEGHPYEIPAHLRITLGAGKVWQEIPPELGSKLGGGNKLDKACKAEYDIGDDIYTGSGEEDLGESPFPCTGFEQTITNDGRNGFFEHFWNPDFPRLTPSNEEQRGYNCGELGDGYNLGLQAILPSACGDHFDSAYRTAQDEWDKAIILYRTGEADKIEEAYYKLGLVAHLLEDIALPAHVHLTPHPQGVVKKIPKTSFLAGPDLYEAFVTARIVDKIAKLGNAIGQEYNVDCLPNLCNFDWSQVHPNPTNLFKLFWYTAQKTQYWAGANKRENLASYGNDFYSTLDGNIEIFTPNLWNGEAFPFESPLQLTNRRRYRNLREMSDALIPHTLKAVAGLYRLFWMEVNAPECPNEFGPPGSLVYMCLVEGNPGIPGDGVIVDSVGDLNDVVDEIRFSLSQPISLRPLTNGITILAFPDSALPLKNDMQFFLEFSVANRPECGWGLQTQATIGPEINGVQGYSLSLSLGYLFPSSCGGAGLDSVYITNVELFPLSEGRVPIVTRLDAVALGNGLWVLP